MRTSLKKRSFIFMLVLLTAITFLTLKSESQALGTWYTATVVGTGPVSGGGYIMLTDTGGAFTNAWMWCDPAQLNQQLATALTAISLGKSVLVNLGSTNPYTLIQGIILYQ